MIAQVIPGVRTPAKPELLHPSDGDAASLQVLPRVTGGSGMEEQAMVIAGRGFVRRKQTLGSRPFPGLFAFRQTYSCAFSQQA